MSASSVTEPGTRAQLYIGTENMESDRMFGALTRKHLSTMKTETQPHNTEFPKITLKTVPDATHNHNMERLQWEADGSLPKIALGFFIRKGNFLSNNIICSDSDFPPGKHPEYISM